MAIVRKDHGRLMIMAVILVASLVALGVWVFQANQRGESKQPKPVQLSQSKITPPVCILNGLTSAYSPSCVHEPVSSGVPESLPALGMCSLGAAKTLPEVSIDFSRYINEYSSSQLASRVKPQVDGLIVSLPAGVYDTIRMLAPEVPDGPVLIYPVTSESFGSLTRSVPSLHAIMASVDMAVDVKIYVTSSQCLPILPVSE